nr:MAG TPA: hypothetical protein [Caudoviricetes sp.]
MLDWKEYEEFKNGLLDDLSPQEYQEQIRNFVEIKEKEGSNDNTSKKDL